MNKQSMEIKINSEAFLMPSLSTDSTRQTSTDTLQEQHFSTPTPQQIQSAQKGCGHFTSKPLKVGRVDMQNYSLGYEIHGQDRGYPIVKIMGVMGFMNSMGGWDRIIDSFINSRNVNKDDDQKVDYQFLVFDNRGIGSSTQGSFTRMTTSSLAKDALQVLDHIGWLNERSVHLMGISMGGMIALELALLASSRFKSLILFVTGPRWSPPPSNRYVAFSVMKHSRTIDDRVKNLMSIIFSDEEFLDSPCDSTRFPGFKTNREQIHANLKQRMETVKKPSLCTFIGQICALWTHNVTKERLALLGKQIPDMIAVGAAADKIVDPELSREIARESGCKLIMYQGKGHVITTEAEHELHAEMKQLWHQAEKRYPST